MYLSVLTALNRKDGKHVILASVAHAAAGRDTSKVANAYRDLVAGTKAGAEKRAKYSHCLLIIENQVRNTHQFPDLPALAAKQERKQARAAAAGEVAAAQKLLDDAAKSKAAADAQFEAARGKAVELGIIQEDEEPPAPEVGNPVIAAAKELRQKANALMQTAQNLRMNADGAAGQANHDQLVKDADAAETAALQAAADADQAEAALQ